MPRVTYETYRQRHLQLRRLWQERQGVFAAVDPMEQWDLHEYFLCADRPTEATLRAHYDEIKDEGSSLPQRAGKVYAALMRNMEAGVPETQPIQPRVAGRKQKVLTIRSLVRPHVDVDAYVATVMQIVDRLAEEDPEQLRKMTRR
ncbi:hypothetical protein OOZ51_00485 [Arthrobacter sp. MI7-26]|uniref:hypothetical protein n=1 Tax=Arthrobacter sp. MI7-26 TaxID=2993653 RepID=UPI0022493E60|nr:hypothetical protein [Arthrobacter sp. MI7-26]MCX2746289.1 hypothetical protein [Arthrobacter sp. MI7-26]